MNFREEITKYKEIFYKVGLYIIPLKPNSKEPMGNFSWRSTSQNVLWENADQNSNIGIRCGGINNLLVIDCDDKNKPGTFSKTRNHLTGLGLQIKDFPIVRTASQVGRHIYIQSENTPVGNCKLFNPVFGSGELRYGEGCYVVGPPSKIDGGGQYELISGDFNKRPIINFQDLLPLIKDNGEKEEASTISIESLSRNAKLLLWGKNVEKYRSRSEAEQALLVSMINKGLSFDDIYTLFRKYPAAGKFKDKYFNSPKNGIDYLRRSFESATKFSKNNISEGRQKAINAMNWASNMVWIGRTGSYDRAIFLAHTQQAYKSGKEVYHASVRDLAEYAGVSIGAVSTANKRLIKKESIKYIKKETINLATLYSLGQTCTLTQYKDVRECISLSNHDLFRYHGFGKNGFEIWESLREGPKTLEEIIVSTGRSKRTIKRKLEKMQRITDLRTGEIYSMIIKENEKFILNHNIDLDFLAELIGTIGLGKKQKHQHELDREKHIYELAYLQNR